MLPVPPTTVTISRRVYEGVAAWAEVGVQLKTPLVRLLLVRVAPLGALTSLNKSGVLELLVAWAWLVKVSAVPSTTVCGGIGSMTTWSTGATLFVTVTVKLVPAVFGVPNWLTLTVKVTDWGCVGVQLNVVEPCGAEFVGAMVAEVAGLLRCQFSWPLAPVVFVMVI